MFNKGDRVRIIGTQSRAYQKYIGTTGAIADVYLSGFYSIITNDGTAATFIRTDVELLKEEHMTLQEKVKKFVEGAAILSTPTQEIYDKLMVELEKRGYKWALNHREWSDIIPLLQLENNELYYGNKGYYESVYMPILELTSADFPEIAQVTIIGDTTIQMKAKVTKGDNGYTIEKLVEPKFAVGEIVMNCDGKVVKITDICDGLYWFQWVDGDDDSDTVDSFEGNFTRFPW